MKNIIALVDLSDASTKVIEHTKTLATAFGSQVILMHVTPPVLPVVGIGGELPPIPVAPTQEMVQADNSRLNELLQPLTKLGIEASAVQFTGPLAETILTETERLHADLVVMGSHHHSALYNLFVGSMTADVLKHATYPVFVVPCDEPVKDKK